MIGKKPLPSSCAKDVIIVVEDSIVSAVALIGLLKKSGFDVIEFGNGQEAWDWLQALSPKDCAKIKAIFADISMPKMDGIELLRKVRSKLDLRLIKYVFCSAVLDPKIVREAISLNSSGYIVKPVMPSVLKKKLDEIFPHLAVQDPTKKIG